MDDRGPEVRFALDSPLEGDGFEPSVPLVSRGADLTGGSRCRAQTRRHRRHRDRRRDARGGGALSGPHPEIGRRHCGRRLLVHDPCPPRRRGDRRGPVRDGIDHAWRERPLRRRAHSQCRGANEPRRPVRAALWANGAADFVHDPGALRRPHQRPQKLLVLAAHSIPPPARARIDCGA